MQYLILDEQKTQSTPGRHDIIDDGVSGTWKLIRDYGETCRPKLSLPKLIISLTDDDEPFFTNQRLLKSVLFDLVKAGDSEGKHAVSSTLSQKSSHLYTLCNFVKSDFQSFCTTGKRMKFATKPI